MEKVSIIIPVLNEEKTIKPLLDVLKKSRAEIIVVDGGSTDNTLKLCKGVKVIKGKYNRSEARNIGVAKASGKIIVFTDAGCIPEKNWLEELLKVKADVVAGYYKGLPQNIFEKCLVPYVLVMPDKLDENFLPSTRSMAIKKDIFIKFGGFNSKLDTSEDFEFANR
ncbi:MAG: glycosyltransferase [Patescibacteria group bacterium]